MIVFTLSLTNQCLGLHSTALSIIDRHHASVGRIKLRYNISTHTHSQRPGWQHQGNVVTKRRLACSKLNLSSGKKKIPTQRLGGPQQIKIIIAQSLLYPTAPTISQRMTLLSRTAIITPTAFTRLFSSSLATVLLNEQSCALRIAKTA